MAKQKDVKISINHDLKSGRTTSLDSEIQTYSHYFDAYNHTYRCFFETPHSLEELDDQRHPKKKYRSVKGFHLVEDGEKIINRSIVVYIARLIAHRHRILPSTGCNAHINCFKSFFVFLESKNIELHSFQDLKTEHVAAWLRSIKSYSRATANKGLIKPILELSEHGRSLKLDKISMRKDFFRSNYNSQDQRIAPTFNNDKSYESKVLFQILAYTNYELEEIISRFNDYKQLTPQQLGDNFVPVHLITCKNQKLLKFFSSGLRGFDLLLANLILADKEELAGKRWTVSSNNWNNYKGKLWALFTTATYRHIFGAHARDIWYQFIEHMESKMWPTECTKETRGHRDFFCFDSREFQTVMLIYFLMTTGVNLETAFSIKRYINNVHWAENYDIELGLHESTPISERQILLIGKKTRGVIGSKKIVIPVKVNSNLYNYMMQYEQTLPEHQVNFFDSRDIHNEMASFCVKYPIYEENTRLKKIHTTKLRKTYTGYKFASLLENTESPADLVYQLREALSHNSFDTTLFSYILKTGIGNNVLDSSILALTTSLIEESLIFKGTFCLGNSTNESSSKVFLCDCSDPSRPTHDQPVSSICTKYDMCLGCARSEVYEHHLKYICYRILQYDDLQLNTNGDLNGLLNDRRYIALDTLNKFRIFHPKGGELVDAAYRAASLAKTENQILLPPIIQF